MNDDKWDTYNDGGLCFWCYARADGYLGDVPCCEQCAAREMAK